MLSCGRVHAGPTRLSLLNLNSQVTASFPLFLLHLLPFGRQSGDLGLHSFQFHIEAHISPQRFHALIEDRKISIVGIQPAILAAGGLADDAEGLKLGEGAAGGVDGHVELGGDGVGAGDGLHLHLLMHPHDVASGTAQGVDPFQVSGKQSAQPACGGDGLLGGVLHAVQEKAHPRLPLTFVAHVSKVVVVLGTMLFEVKAEVEQRLMENALRTQQESDQQAAQTAIAIEEGVNGLELDMNEGRLDQGGWRPDHRA